MEPIQPNQYNRGKRKAIVEFQALGDGDLTNHYQQQGNEFNSSILPKFSNNEYLKFFESLPTGYRFCPHDSELIVHYLNKKVWSEELPPNNIQELNLYLYNPNQLIANYPIQGEEKEWYFFTPRDRKYKNGTRPNRAAGDGYWKVNGTEKSIIDNGISVGFRNSLVFYVGKHPKGTRTQWHMHEFRLNEPPRIRSANDMRLDDFVLCRVYKKEEKAKTTPARAEPNGKPTENSLVAPAHENNLLEGTDCNYEDNYQLQFQNGAPTMNHRSPTRSEFVPGQLEDAWSSTNFEHFDMDAQLDFPDFDMNAAELDISDFEDFMQNYWGSFSWRDNTPNNPPPK